MADQLTGEELQADDRSRFMETVESLDRSRATLVAQREMLLDLAEHWPDRAEEMAGHVAETDHAISRNDKRVQLLRKIIGNPRAERPRNVFERFMR